MKRYVPFLGFLLIFLATLLFLWWVTNPAKHTDPPTHATTVWSVGNHGRVEQVTRFLRRVPVHHAAPAPVRKPAFTARPTPHPTKALRAAAPTGFAAWLASPMLAHVIACESGGNPRAVSAGGVYRGLLQMDRTFWLHYGGDPSLTPDQASRSAQLLVGYQGWRSRGWQPWTCSR